MLESEIASIVEESTRKLLQISGPTVRYYLLHDIIGVDIDDPQLLRAIEECRRHPRRLKLLQTLRADGTWPISKERRLAEERGPGPPVGWTYITMLRNLYDLAEYQTSIDEGNVREVFEKILSWQTKDGYILGPTSQYFPDTHYNGYALRAMLSFGLHRDPRVRKLSDWLLRMQRPDGGWLSPYVQDLKYHAPYKNMAMPSFISLVGKLGMEKYDPTRYYSAPSCIWTTMMVVRGFTQSYEKAALPEVHRGAEYFLDRFFMRNYYSSFYRTDDNWTKLKYPTYFGSGMCALDILTWMGYGADEPRLEKPIKWLLGARMPDGLWCQSDRPNAEKDQSISEVCISILNRYAQSLRGELFGRAEQMAQGRKDPD